MSADALIPAGKPRRCRHCHRPIPKGPSYGGLGSRCAEEAGLVPHAVRVAKPVRESADDEPNLLDLIEGANGDEADLHEESRTPIGHRGQNAE